jgi:hypothetical protein
MRIAIEIELPEASEIIKYGHAVSIAPKGVRWSKSCLGEMHKEQGIYVIHHAGIIKYVGKTDAATMSFGTRLRKHFQENAAQGKHTYPKLSMLTVPPEVYVRCFPFSELRQRIAMRNAGPQRQDQIIALFETLMINQFQPEYQRHAENSYNNRFVRLMFAGYAKNFTELAKNITDEDLRKYIENESPS